MRSLSSPSCWLRFPSDRGSPQLPSGWEVSSGDHSSVLREARRSPPPCVLLHGPVAPGFVTTPDARHGMAVHCWWLRAISLSRHCLTSAVAIGDIWGKTKRPDEVGSKWNSRGCSALVLTFRVHALFFNAALLGGTSRWGSKTGGPEHFLIFISSVV